MHATVTVDSILTVAVVTATVAVVVTVAAAIAGSAAVIVAVVVVASGCGSGSGSGYESGSRSGSRSGSGLWYGMKICFGRCAGDETLFTLMNSNLRRIAAGQVSLRTSHSCGGRTPTRHIVVIWFDHIQELVPT